MIKKVFSKVAFMTCLLFITACSNSTSTYSNSNDDNAELQEDLPKEHEDMISVNLTMNAKTFPAVFYDNETTQAFIEQMPLTLHMNDLNHNEKYYNLPNNLPTENTERPEVINKGEIMVWTSNTIVIFYDTFSNSFGGYTRLGYIENTDGLVEALGSENVDVTFELITKEGYE